MKKILVVNVNWVGDVIFSIPVFKTLKKHFPGCRISCLAVPRVREVLEGIPSIDEIIVYDEQGAHRLFWGKLRLIKDIAREKFDIAFLLHRSLTRALLVFFAGIPQRVGYPTKGRGIFLTQKAQYSTEGLHRSDYYTQVIESLGFKVNDRICDLEVSCEALKKAESLLCEKGIGAGEAFVVVHVAGNWNLKRWPKERWTELIDQLQNQTQCKVVIPGTPKDKLLIDEIEQGCFLKPVVLTGKTNLKELIALLSKADFIISADSGPLHLASAVGIKGIGLFGPTRPEVTGPRGRGRIAILQKDVECNRDPCYNLDCQDNICMKSIAVKDVMDEVRRIKN